jgi:hypothetical protein
MKSHTVEAELSHADGWTDMTKVIVTFGKFASAHKNVPNNKFDSFNSLVAYSAITAIHNSLLTVKRAKLPH